MPNYNETPVSGNQWTRCHTVEIQNPYQGQKSIRFHEQNVIVMDNNETIYRSRSAVPLQIGFDPTKTVQLLNTETGQPTGATFTHGDLYAMLFSAYLAAAQERDQNNN